MIGFRGSPQTIVTLLLLVAIITQPSEGQFCYECEANKPGAPATEQCHYLQLQDKDIKECSESETYCHQSGREGKDKRGCYSKIKGDCLKKYVTDTCYDSARHGTEISDKVKECVEAAGEQGEQLPQEIDVCICSGQLSNQGGLGNDQKKPCPKELVGLGPVEGTGIMCYKCEGGKETDCGKRKLDNIPKVNCPDWRFGKTIWKAGCFKSRSGGKGAIYVRGCGFQSQAYCRLTHFANTCTLSRADVVEYKDKDELNTKQYMVKDCEIGADTDKINLRQWYNKQPKSNESQYGRVVGNLGELQEDIGTGNIHINYRDCVCIDPLCNPAGCSTCNWGVIMALLFVVLNQELFYWMQF